MPIHLGPIDRRSFLRGTLAAGAGLALSGRLPAKEPAGDPNSFLLLSDIHVSMNPDEQRNGIKPHETFKQATREILALDNRPPRAIVSGDCAYLKGRVEDYAALKKLLLPLRRSGMSLHFAMGNHDNRENFLTAFPEAKPPAEMNLSPGKYVSVIETDYANWFLLDSLDSSRGATGVLGELQLKWLADALDARPNKPALLVAHHNLNPLFEYKSLSDTKFLLEMISSRRQVKAYFFGHTHWWGVGRLAGIHLVNVPTTAWTFKLNSCQPQGFVTAQLKPDGASLKLHALDHNHQQHGQTVQLKWS